MLERETVIIGDKEFAFGQIPVFEKAALFLKIQRVITAGLANVNKDAKLDGIGMFAAILPNITEKELDDIILPMFAKAQLVSVTDSKKIDSKMALNQCVSDLDVLFELAFEVGKYLFLPSLLKLKDRFGQLNGDQKTTD